MRIDFGWQPVGEWSAPRSISVANGGDAPLRIRRAALTGPHASEFRLTAEDFSGVDFYPGRSCNIDVRFAPQGAGLRRAFLLLTSNAPDSPWVVELQGNAAAVSHMQAHCRPQFWRRQLTLALPVAIEATPKAGKAQVHFGARRVTGQDCDRKIIQELDILVPVTVDVTGACGDEEPQHRRVTCTATRRIAVEIPIHVGAEVTVAQEGAACMEAGVR
ncbi:MAG TPA: choice-of-anchor D domain-containing protein [Symbiobacteriaceae bacterium]|nr:choice-of-anchor D domain-containing protein [Symbiobacteriaceae bacterium]